MLNKVKDKKSLLLILFFPAIISALFFGVLLVWDLYQTKITSHFSHSLNVVSIIFRLLLLSGVLASIYVLSKYKILTTLVVAVVIIGSFTLYEHHENRTRYQEYLYCLKAEKINDSPSYQSPYRAIDIQNCYDQYKGIIANTN